jgi:hypothetical protein
MGIGWINEQNFFYAPPREQLIKKILNVFLGMEHVHDLYPFAFLDVALKNLFGNELKE